MKRLSLFVILLALLLTACNGETPTPTIENTEPATAIQTPATATATFTPSPTLTATPTATATAMPTATPEPVVYGPDNFPNDVNPLTGLIAADPKLLERRPIAVKINLVPRTLYRPAWGLSLADIVFDYYHNDGYSRLHAIFYGQDAELIGAIRSGRLFDSDLVQMYKSVFAYGSADARINFRLLNATYSNRLVLEGQRSNCPPSATAPLCRYEPNGGDFLLTSSSALSQFTNSKGVENGRQNLNGMNFASQVPENGTDITQAFVRYSGDNYSRWDYNAVAGSYLLYQDNVFDQGQGEDYAALIDRLNGQQVSAANVVIIVAPHQYYQEPPAEIVEVVVSGSGPAYALRDGKLYQVTWNRPTIDSVLYLTFPDGSRYPFKPGSTWFQVVGNSTTITQPQNDTWRFEHHIP